MLLASKNRLAIAFLIAIASLVSQTACAKETLFPNRSHGGGELRYVGNVPVAILAGTPEQIGEQYAMLVGKPGAPLLKFTRKMLAEVGQESAWPMVVHVSRQLLQRAPQRYQSELAAAIEHAQVDSDEMFVANSLLELRRLGCSTLIVEPQRSATSGPIFGRNFDFPSLGMLNKYSVLTIVRPDGKRAFASVSFPGLIGVISGMNDAGLAIANARRRSQRQWLASTRSHRRADDARLSADSRRVLHRRRSRSTAAAFEADHLGESGRLRSRRRCRIRIDADRNRSARCRPRALAVHQSLSQRRFRNRHRVYTLRELAHGSSRGKARCRSCSSAPRPCQPG